MTISKSLILSLIALSLTACAPDANNHRYNDVGNGSYNVTKSSKRLNTIDCKDSDDWYLDGYRVGKSFSQQKQQQFEHRVQYCLQKTGKKISNNIKAYWEQGYKIGLKESGYNQAIKKSKKSSKRKK